MLKRILQNISTIVLPEYEGIRLTTSIGATLCANEPIHIAVSRADRLLYKAKIHKNVIVTDKDGEISEEKGKATILIVDDSEINRDILSSILSNEFNIIEASGGKECIEALEKYGTEISLVLLDIMMPEVDGFDICRQVRQEKNTPIIMVSAKKDDIDKIRGLGLGADDYMTKPFSPSELVARVKAHMDRYNRLIGSNVRKNDIVEIRGIKIDKTARRVWVNGEEKTFTSKEYDLLTFLAENPNRVFTK